MDNFVRLMGDQTNGGPLSDNRRTNYSLRPVYSPTASSNKIRMNQTGQPTFENVSNRIQILGRCGAFGITRGLGSFHPVNRFGGKVQLHLGPKMFLLVYGLQAYSLLDK